jgi:hypothetical protein
MWRSSALDHLDIATIWISVQHVHPSWKARTGGDWKLLHICLCPCIMLIMQLPAWLRGCWSPAMLCWFRQKLWRGLCRHSWNGWHGIVIAGLVIFHTFRPLCSSSAAICSDRVMHYLQYKPPQVTELSQHALGAVAHKRLLPHRAVLKKAMLKKGNTCQPHKDLLQAEPAKVLPIVVHSPCARRECKFAHCTTAQKIVKDFGFRYASSGAYTRATPCL